MTDEREKLPVLTDDQWRERLLAAFPGNVVVAALVDKRGKGPGSWMASMHRDIREKTGLSWTVGFIDLNGWDALKEENERLRERQAMLEGQWAITLRASMQPCEFKAAKFACPCVPCSAKRVVNGKGAGIPTKEEAL